MQRDSISLTDRTVTRYDWSSYLFHDRFDENTCERERVTWQTRSDNPTSCLSFVYRKKGSTNKNKTTAFLNLQTKATDRHSSHIPVVLSRLDEVNYLLYQIQIYISLLILKQQRLFLIFRIQYCLKKNKVSVHVLMP